MIKFCRFIKLTTGVVLFSIITGTAFGQTNTVFFSEYIEGSGQRQALEIYNGSGSTIDLTEFSIQIYLDGGSTALTTTTLGGTLAAGEVYLVGVDQFDFPVTIDFFDIVAIFNGDDGLALLHNEVIIDFIGGGGTAGDPGSGWSVAGVDNATASHTLVRKQSVTEGNPTPLASFTNDEWIVYDLDEFRYLGSHCNYPSTQASNVTFGATDETSMVVNWTKGNGDKSLVVVKEGAAVDASPVSGANYTTATADFSVAEVPLGTNNVVVYSDNSNAQTVTVTGLTSGETYYVAVYAYNATDFCYNFTSPARDSKRTTTPNDADSYITAVVGGETDNIKYIDYLTASDLTMENSASLFTFSINDKGTSDGLATILTDISFEFPFQLLSTPTPILSPVHRSLRTLALFVDDDNIAQLDVFGSNLALNVSTVSFTGLDIQALDNGNKEVNVRATFVDQTAIDGQQIGLTISAVTAVASGSLFAAANGGGATTDISNDVSNTIQVDATKLRIQVEPTAVGTAFKLTVTATDDFFSLDKDVDQEVTLSLETGTGNFTSASSLTARLASGNYTWDDLQYDKAETIRIRVTDNAASSPLTSATSGNIEIVTTITSVFFSEYIEGGSDNKALEIYNGSDSEVDLSEFTISIYVDAAVDPVTSFNVSNIAVLAAGDVFVMASTGAHLDIARQADDKPDTFDFNGNDGIALLHNGVIVDFIGSNGGTDPGIGWDVASTTEATANHTLVRKQSVTEGNPRPLASFTDDEWIVYAQDEFRYLGSHCDFPPTQASNVAFGGTDPASMVVNWTKGDGDHSLVVVKEDYAVNGTPVSGVNYTTATAVYSAREVDLDMGNIVVYSGNLETVTVTGLSRGELYHVAVYSYNEADLCYNTISPVRGSHRQRTTDTSTITRVGGETASIAYETFQATSNLIDTNSASLFTFEINDSATGTADGLPTILTDISFTITNHENLKTLALFVDGTNMYDLDVATAIESNGSDYTLPFSGLRIEAPISSSKEVNVRATFSNNVNDGDRIKLTISAVTADASGSLFVGVNGDAIGGGVATIASNAIKVTATALDIEAPVDAVIDTDFRVIVKAVDDLGNIAVFGSLVTVTLSHSGSGALNSSDGLVQRLQSGVYRWNDFQYNVAEPITITVEDDASGLTSFTSENITFAPTPAVATTFTIEVPSTVVGTRSTPFEVTVTAVDDVGNIDIDAEQEVTLSHSGSGALTSSRTGLTARLDAGTYTWDDLEYDADGTIRITVADNADSSPLTSAISGNIEIVTIITSVFFSEYIEGSDDNQALEIYNGSGGDVNLADFSTSLSSNGSIVRIILTGNLAAGDVYVIRNGSAGSEISFQADATSGTAVFDGNDAIALLHNGVIVDIIGDNVGTAPGSGWPVAGTAGATADHTLVRKQSVTEGNPTPLASFTDDEWIVYDQDEFRYLGTHCNAPSTQATSVTFGDTGETSMVVNWTKGGGNKSLVVVKEGSAVDATPVLATGYLLATNVFSDAASTLTTGNVVVYSGDSDDQTVTVTGLTQGRTYHVAVYAYNEVDFCYNITSPARSSQTIPDTDSYITASSPGGETASIAYDDFQTTSDLMVGNSASLFTFNINDKGTADGMSTTLTAISFEITNYENLIRLALFDVDDNRKLAELEVTGSTVAFTGLTIVALDDSNKAVNVRATFSENVVDKQQIGLTISAVTAATTGSSTFAAGDGGGATTISSNQIEVTATKFNIEVPTDAVVVNATFPVTVTAVDELGNTDLDAVSEVTLTTTGTGTLSSVGGSLTAMLANGTYTWDDLQYNAEGIITITVAGGGLTSATSESISVTATAVTATRFTIEVPSGAGVDTPFSVTVTAVDVDGATATDATAGTAVTLSHSGSGALTSSRSSLTATLANGVYRWDDLQYNAEGMITITVAGGGLTSATSDPINVFPLLTTVFFSEYIEGGSQNKALEIYNGSGGEVDLSEFTIDKYANGSPSATTYSLTEENFVAGEVYVIAHNHPIDVDMDIRNQADLRDNFFSFNGNDAIALLHNGVIVDIIGDNRGEDPDRGWSVAGTTNATENHTLVRKQSITQGNDIGNDDETAGGSFGTTLDNSEWIVYDQNEFRYLGTHCNLPSTQATNVIFGATDETSMVVNWTKGDGNNSLVVVKAASAVDETPTWNNGYTGATDVFSDAAATLGTGNVVVYSADLATVTVTGLTSGETYHVAVYAYNADRFCYNTASPARSSQATTTAPDTDSHITASDGETASIVYGDFQVTPSLSDTNSASLFTFDINDIGTDGLSTTLTAISFEITNYENLIKLALFVDDTDKIAELDVGSNTVAFTGLTIVASSGTSKAVNVRATFSENVDDGEKIRLTISAVTAATLDSSTFAAGDGGGAATDPTLNAIAVTASKLDITDPGTARINENFDLTVKAVDNLGNTDVDAETDVTLGLASGATGALNLVGSGLMARLSGGTHTYDLQYNRAEIIRITVEDNASTLTSFTSENINIVTTLPVFTVVASSPIAFGPVDNRANSASKSFTVEGTNLTHAIEVTATNGFEVSLIMDSGFGTSVELTKETDGTLTDGTVTVYVRFSPISGTNGDVNSNIALNTSGAVAEQTIPVTGTETGNPPAFIVVASSPIAFGPVDHGANSASQSFTVEGTNLTANIEVEVQANARANGFEVSLIMDSGFGSSVDIAASGTLRSTPVYVRFSPNSGINGDVTGDILLTTEGAVEQTVSVMGTEAGNPAFTVTDTPLNDFGNVNNGANSGSQMFTVSGENLTDNITVTAKDGFQVSLTTEDSGFATTVDLTPDAATGAVTSTPVHVRFSPTSGTGDVNSDIVLSTTGADNQTVSVSGTVVVVVASKDATSTITRVAGGESATPIAYGGLQEKTPLTTGNSASLFTFEINDSDTGTDGLPTILTEISFEITNHENLRTLALFDGSMRLAELVVAANIVTNTLTFSGFPEIKAPTGSNKEVNVRATFLESVVDGQQIGLTISAVTAKASGSSTFAENDGAPSGESAATTDLTDSDSNAIVVTAKEFVIEVSGRTRISEPFELKVTAVDKRGNTDVADRRVTLSQTKGTGLTSSMGLGPVAMTDGVYTWDDLESPTEEVITVTVTDNSPSGALSPVTSGDINIVPTLPTITVTGTPLDDFESVNHGDTSDVQSFTVSGTDLTANITVDVEATSGFEVSLGSDTNFGSSVDLTPDVASGAVTDATVYVRFAPRSGINGQVTVDITLNTSGAAEKTVSVMGTETGNVSTITVTGTPLDDFGSVNHGETSESQSFAVVGANLTTDITVTAPDGFQISLDDTSFGTSVDLTPDAATGAVTSTTVHVRFAPRSGTGEVTENIVLSATDAASQSVEVTGTVTVATLTGIGQESLKYNISVYPNPSEEVFHITIPESFGTGEVKLVSLDGAVVQKGSIGKMKQIETSNLRRGIYLLQILNATTVVNYRVVVK